MTNKKTIVTPKGGPGRPGRQWERTIETVSEQVASLLEEVDSEGEFTLHAMQPRRGGSHNQGLHIQRYDDSDPVRPSIFFVAQPFGNDSCWLYRLQFPRGSDVQSIYTRMEAVLQQKPKESAVTAQVVSLQPPAVPISVARKSEPLEPYVNTEPKPLKKSVAGMAKDAVIAATLLSHLLEAMRQEGTFDTLSIASAVAAQAMLVVLGDGHTRQHAGSVLGGLVLNKYLTHDRQSGVYQITKFAVAVMRKQGIEVPNAPDAPAASPPKEQARRHESTPASSLAQVEDIASRALVFEEARRACAEQKERLQKILNEAASVERNLEKLRVEEKEVRETLQNAERIINDPVFKGAFAERDRLRRLLGGS